jgi:hypothetical protein
MSTIDQVLSEFIDAWNAGKRPRVRDYLARLPDGPDRDALASALSTWLETAPTPTYSEAARTEIASEPTVADLFARASTDAGLWPTVVPQLRSRAGLSTTDLATRLVERFSLSRSDVPRTQTYLERLEAGSLDPTRVSRRLLDAVGALLGVSGSSLADTAVFSRSLRSPAAGGALFRAEGQADDQLRHDIEILSKAALAPSPAPMNEVARLFTGGLDA